MRTFVYEQPRELDPAQFADYLDPSRTAVISIDLHRGHLDDSPECPCPAPRARELVELERRARLYRGGRPEPALAQRHGRGC